MSLISALRTYFGFDSFRAGQEDATRSLLDGSHTLAIMPTGAGKSLIYQFAALMVGAEMHWPSKPFLPRSCWQVKCRKTSNWPSKLRVSACFHPGAPIYKLIAPAQITPTRVSMLQPRITFWANALMKIRF